MYRVFTGVPGELPQVIQVFVVIVWRLLSFDCLPCLLILNGSQNKWLPCLLILYGSQNDWLCCLLILYGSQNNTFVSNFGRLDITVLVEGT